jgi:hypothetical protein
VTSDQARTLITNRDDWPPLPCSYRSLLHLLTHIHHVVSSKVCSSSSGFRHLPTSTNHPIKALTSDENLHSTPRDSDEKINPAPTNMEIAIVNQFAAGGIASIATPEPRTYRAVHNHRTIPYLSTLSTPSAALTTKPLESTNHSTDLPMIQLSISKRPLTSRYPKNLPGVLDSYLVHHRRRRRTPLLQALRFTKTTPIALHDSSSIENPAPMISYRDQ